MHYLYNVPTSVPVRLVNVDKQQAHRPASQDALSGGRNDYPLDGQAVEANNVQERITGRSGRVQQSILKPSQSSPSLKTYSTTKEEERSDSVDHILGGLRLSSSSLGPTPMPSGINTPPIQQLTSNGGENGRNGSGLNRNQITCPIGASASLSPQLSTTLSNPTMRALNASTTTDLYQSHFQTPYRTIGPSSAAENQVNAQFSEHGITQRLTSNTDTISTPEELSWQSVDGRVTIRVPIPPAGQSPREPWAIHHKQHLGQLETSSEDLLVYSDGSLRFEPKPRSAGAGVVGLRHGKVPFLLSFPLGTGADVYDAEMEGLAKGAELVWQWMYAQGPDHGITRVWFFTDSTGALRRIYTDTWGRVHDCTHRFRIATHEILDAYPHLMINIEWVPAHCDIPGNEIADALAKCGSASLPISIGFGRISAARLPNVHRREAPSTTESSSSNESEELWSPVLPSLKANAATDAPPNHASEPFPINERTPAELSEALEKPTVLSPPLSPAVRQYELGHVGQLSDSVIIPSEDTHDESYESESDTESDYTTEQGTEYCFTSDSGYGSD